MPDYLPDTLHNIHMEEGLTKWEAVSFISTDSWGKNRSPCRGSVRVSRCCNGGGCSALLGTGQERISISCRSCRCCLCRHNPYPDPMTLCYSRVQIDVIATKAGNLAMVHTFPNLSVLFSGRVHISLDNTGEGGAGVQTMLLHQITRVLSTLSAASSRCHDTVTQHQGIQPTNIFGQ